MSSKISVGIVVLVMVASVFALGYVASHHDTMAPVGKASGVLTGMASAEGDCASGYTCYSFSLDPASGSPFAKKAYSYRVSKTDLETEIYKGKDSGGKDIWTKIKDARDITTFCETTRSSLAKLLSYREGATINTKVFPNRCAIFAGSDELMRILQSSLSQHELNEYKRISGFGGNDLYVVQDELTPEGFYLHVGSDQYLYFERTSSLSTVGLFNVILFFQQAFADPGASVDVAAINNKVSGESVFVNNKRYAIILDFDGYVIDIREQALSLKDVCVTSLHKQELDKLLPLSKMTLAYSSGTCVLRSEDKVVLTITVLENQDLSSYESFEKFVDGVTLYHNYFPSSTKGGAEIIILKLSQERLLQFNRQDEQRLPAHLLFRFIPFFYEKMQDSDKAVDVSSLLQGTQQSSSVTLAGKTYYFRLDSFGTIEDISLLPDETPFSMASFCTPDDKRLIALVATLGFEVQNVKIDFSKETSTCSLSYGGLTVLSFKHILQIDRAKRSLSQFRKLTPTKITGTEMYVRSIYEDDLLLEEHALVDGGTSSFEATRNVKLVPDTTFTKLLSILYSYFSGSPSPSSNIKTSLDSICGESDTLGQLLGSYSIDLRGGTCVISSSGRTYTLFGERPEESVQSRFLKDVYLLSESRQAISLSTAQGGYLSLQRNSADSVNQDANLQYLRLLMYFSHKIDSPYQSYTYQQLTSVVPSLASVGIKGEKVSFFFSGDEVYLSKRVAPYTLDATDIGFSAFSSFKGKTSHSWYPFASSQSSAQLATEPSISFYTKNGKQKAALVVFQYHSLDDLKRAYVSLKEAGKHVTQLSDPDVYYGLVPKPSYLFQDYFIMKNSGFSRNNVPLLVHLIRTDSKDFSLKEFVALGEKVFKKFGPSTTTIQRFSDFRSAISPLYYNTCDGIAQAGKDLGKHFGKSDLAHYRMLLATDFPTEQKALVQSDCEIYYSVRWDEQQDRIATGQIKDGLSVGTLRIYAVADPAYAQSFAKCPTGGRFTFGGENDDDHVVCRELFSQGVTFDNSEVYKINPKYTHSGYVKNGDNYFVLEIIYEERVRKSPTSHKSTLELYKTFHYYLS